jgi:hypothetical protein
MKPLSSLMVMPLLCGATMLLAACSENSDSEAKLAPTTEEPPVAAVSEKPVDPEDAADCMEAKKAAVSARKVYDRDYERRNPGASSAALSIDELTSCKLADDGAFVGKWGGTRWRFVPKARGRYATDPKQVWVGENEGLDDLSWFSEWRSDGASVAKNAELNRSIKVAREIEG